jgi:hypothetical protein
MKSKTHLGLLFVCTFGIVFLLAATCQRNSTTASPSIQNSVSLDSPVPNATVNDKSCSADWQLLVSPRLKEKLSTKKIQLLSESFPEENSVEVRVWVGFGATSLRGVIIKRINGKLRTFYLSEKIDAHSDIINISELEHPRSEPQEIIALLSPEELLKLKDECEIEPHKIGSEDGDLILVECRIAPEYNAVLYQHPEKSETEAARTVATVLKTVESRFHLSLYWRD